MISCPFPSLQQGQERQVIQGTQQVKRLRDELDRQERYGGAPTAFYETFQIKSSGVPNKIQWSSKRLNHLPTDITSHHTACRQISSTEKRMAKCSTEKRRPLAWQHFEARLSFYFFLGVVFPPNVWRFLSLALCPLCFSLCVHLFSFYIIIASPTLC